MVLDDVTATALVSLDDDVIATAPEISEGNIIEELMDRQEQGEEEENDDEISIEEIFDPVVEKPLRSTIESALDDLKDAAMFRIVLYCIHSLFSVKSNKIIKIIHVYIKLHNKYNN